MAKVGIVLKEIEAEREGRADLVPAGLYVGKIVSAEPKQTKAGTGAYIALSLQIQEGEHKGKTFIDNVTIQNPNVDAVRIGLARLKGIMEKGGHKNPNQLNDTDELIGLKLQAVLSQEKSVGTNGQEYTNNRVDKYKALDKGISAAPANPMESAAIPPVIPAGGQTVFPWQAQK